MQTAGLPWRHGMALLLCAAGLALLMRAVLSQQPLWDTPLLLSAVLVTALLRRRHAPAHDAEDGWGAAAPPSPSLAPQPADARARVDALRRVNELNRTVIASLAMAIDARGCDPHSHVYCVREYAVALAERLRLSPEELEAVKIAALLHDIGKLGVPEHILGKPGKLTSDEFEIIKSHVTIGTMILEPVRFPWPVVPIVLSHHERWDGNGYPHGLSGEAIPIGGTDRGAGGRVRRADLDAAVSDGDAAGEGDRVHPGGERDAVRPGGGGGVHRDPARGGGADPPDGAVQRDGATE
jgi:putative nucleotidyltransferase with HDIG domain